MTDGGWYADITPTAFGYSIRIGGNGMELVQRWWRPTRASAERTGRRIAAKQDAAEARRNQTWRVKP